MCSLSFFEHSCPGSGQHHLQGQKVSSHLLLLEDHRLCRIWTTSMPGDVQDTSRMITSPQTGVWTSRVWPSQEGPLLTLLFQSISDRLESRAVSWQKKPSCQRSSNQWKPLVYQNLLRKGRTCARAWRLMWRTLLVTRLETYVVLFIIHGLEWSSTCRWA